MRWTEMADQADVGNRMTVYAHEKGALEDQMGLLWAERGEGLMRGAPSPPGWVFRERCSTEEAMWVRSDRYFFLLRAAEESRKIFCGHPAQKNLPPGVLASATKNK